MTDLPPGHGPAATQPPEARFVCDCGAEFRWAPEWHNCETCGEKLCEECRIRCNFCCRFSCATHARNIDGFYLCPSCGNAHEIDMKDIYG